MPKTSRTFVRDMGSGLLTKYHLLSRVEGQASRELLVVNVCHWKEPDLRPAPLTKREETEKQIQTQQRLILHWLKLQMVRMTTTINGFLVVVHRLLTMTIPSQTPLLKDLVYPKSWSSNWNAPNWNNSRYRSYSCTSSDTAVTRRDCSSIRLSGYNPRCCFRYT